MSFKAVKTLRTCFREIQSAQAFLENLLGRYRLSDFAVRLWDGTTWNAHPSHPPRCTLVLKDAGALKRMFRRASHHRLRDSYLRGDFDVEGDLEAAFGLADILFEIRWTMADRFRFGRFLLSLPPTSPLHLRQPRLAPPLPREAVPDDFFRLWLDRRMITSAAYFADPQESLEEAQDRKLAYLCRKLRLRPGERLLDLDCGQGSLLIHAAGRYGIEAVGLTSNRARATSGREAIRQAGLRDRCRIEEGTIHDLADAGPFDKIVATALIEEVGEGGLPRWLERVWHLLRPGGAFLLQGVTSSLAPELAAAKFFQGSGLFPASELPPITDALRIAELTGFEIRDLESLREHQLLTLRWWLRHLERERETARRLTDEGTYRYWRLLLAGACHHLRQGTLKLYQSLLVKPDCGTVQFPLTRQDWYR